VCGRGLRAWVGLAVLCKLDLFALGAAGGALTCMRWSGWRGVEWWARV